MAGEIIRPSDIATERTTPVATEYMVSDNGTSVAKVTIENIVKAGRPVASQAEAEAGVESTKAMTPLTTKQAIVAQGDVRFGTAAQGAKADTAVQSVTAGTNVTVDNTDPKNPIISVSGAGTGDVVGPASAVADRIAVFSGTTGKIIKDGGKTVAEIVTPSPPQGRLTLSSISPVTEADIENVSTIYFAGGNTVPIWNGSNFAAISAAAGISLALDSNSGHSIYQQADKVYDLFAILDGSTLRLASGPSWDAGAVAGTNFARGTGAGSTELEFFNGFLVNKNAMTVRFGSASGNTVAVAARSATYLGSFAPTANGQASDSKQKRRLFNAHNREIRPVFVSEVSTNWNYSVATWRQSNGNTANYVEVLNGLAGIAISLTVKSLLGATGAVNCHAGVGVNSTTGVPDEQLIDAFTTVSGGLITLSQAYNAYPGLGLNKFNWLELGSASATVTWYGSVAGVYRAGISGSVCV